MAAINAQFTADDLAAINAALKSGHLEVKYADKSVRYHSVGELIKLRQLIANDLTNRGVISASALSNRGTSTLAQFIRD